MATLLALSLVVAGCGGNGAIDTTLAAVPPTTSSTTTGPSTSTTGPNATGSTTVTMTVAPTTAPPATTTAVTVAPPPAWERVDEGGTVFGGPGNQAMLGVTAAGPGFVAVGYDGPENDLDPAVWVSADGRDWQRAPADPTQLGGQYDEMMVSVVAGGPGVVAVGWDLIHPANAAPSSRSRELRAAVWTSSDGLTWSRVPHSESIFGGKFHKVMSAVTAGGPGFVAVGYTTDPTPARPLGETSAAVWTSPDGLTWSRVPHSESVFGGPGEERMTSVAAVPGGVVAVGTTTRGDGHTDAAVWVSPDGIGWSRVPHNAAVFGGEASQEMLGVTAGGPGIVAVGWRWRNDLPGDKFAVVWTSTDGVSWSTVGYDESVFGGKGQQSMEAVAATPAGLVAVGEDSPFTGGTHVWVSVDGLSWERVLVPEAVRPYADAAGVIYVPTGGEPWYFLGPLHAVAAGGAVLVAVGDDSGFTFDTSAVVLVGPAAG